MRGVIILLLLGALGGLMVWYGSLNPAPGQWVFPGTEELGTNYGAYVGDRTTLVGTVTDTDPLRMQREYGTGEVLRVTVVGYEGTVSPGDRFAVYGIVQPEHQVRVLNAYAIPRGNYATMYLISFFAGLWALTRIVRGWRFDREAVALEPREEPLRLSTLLGNSPHSEEGEDA